MSGHHGNRPTSGSAFLLRLKGRDEGLRLEQEKEQQERGRQQIRGWERRKGGGQ